VEPPEQPIERQALEHAVLRAIGGCCRQLLDGPIQNIGLSALRKWAALLTDERNPKAWRKVFQQPVDLYGALMSAYLFIEISGTGSGGFRWMFAGFLVLRESRFERTACRHRDCARLWSAVARAALPDWIEELRETRELLAEKNRIFEEQPPDALESMAGINQRLEGILERVRSGFPDHEKEVPELLASLSDAVLRLCQGELEAAEQLRASIQ